MSIVGFSSATAKAQEGNPPQVTSSGFPVPAQTAVKTRTSRMIEMRPSQKRPLTLKSQERNPYARRSEGERTATTTGVDSEESRIRGRLGALAVTGSSRGPNNDLKVQMGDITLEQGRILPQLIEDQTVNLQVTELTEESITLGWLDIETMEFTGKTMRVAYDLSPKIMYQLSGQARQVSKTGAKTVKPKMGYLQLGKKNQNRAAGIVSKDSEDDSSGASQ